MENKQTAVEWLFEKTKSHFEHDGDLFEVACFTYAIAKQKEKEQMHNTWEDGFSFQSPYDSFEEYYNKTYGK